MNLILLSGGSGKRLWPLSNDSRSKQFLKVLENEEGIKESMVQRVWRQLERSELAKNSVIATNASQVEMIKSQIGTNVRTVTEPCRRDTFPAIALSVSYLYSVMNKDPQEFVSVLPVDPFVEDSFFLKVKELEKVLNDSDSEIALIGAEPTFPSEKYGYIVPSEVCSEKNYLEVKSFKEKPSQEIAKKLIDNKAFWNCGVFAFRMNYILEHLKNINMPIEYSELIQKYEELPKISFDYEIVEKAKNITVLPYQGYWKDLGTWNTLTDEIKNSITGKGIISSDSQGSKLINELNIPIAVIGISNAVVAASPDGILITDRELSPQVKEYANMFNDRPMFEERRWGWYRVIDYTKYKEGNEVLTKRIGILSGKNLSYQVHYKRSESWTILKGEGILLLEDQFHHLRSGDSINIPLGTRHAIKAITDMELIEIQTGSELVEEDVHRISLEWEEIISNFQIVNNVK